MVTKVNFFFSISKYHYHTKTNTGWAVLNVKYSLTRKHKW